MTVQYSIERSGTGVTTISNVEAAPIVTDGRDQNADKTPQIYQQLMYRISSRRSLPCEVLRVNPDGTLYIGYQNTRGYSRATVEPRRVYRAEYQIGTCQHPRTALEQVGYTDFDGTDCHEYSKCCLECGAVVDPKPEREIIF